jgi:hypothetical protein
MLKLPKGLQSHPCHQKIEALFTQDLQKLWSKGKILVPTWEFSPSFAKALHSAVLNRHVVHGLEESSKNLERQQLGLTHLQQQTGQVQNERLSRLIIFSSDGSERFYRDAESLLLRHKGRLMGCIAKISAEEMGAQLIPPHPLVKALLINDRKALEEFLVALVEV